MYCDAVENGVKGRVRGDNMNGMVCEITAKMASDFLLPRHYSGRIPTISKAFGWFDKEIMTMDHLMAVCTFGKPASNSLCVGICGGGTQATCMN